MPGEAPKQTDELVLRLLRTAAAGKAPPAAAAYVTLTTADVLLAAIDADLPRWEDIAERAAISFEGYRANLRWAGQHPTEPPDGEESEADRALPGVRLSATLARAVEAMPRVAARAAASERPDVAGLFAPLLLSIPDADAATGLAGDARTRLRRSALLELHGTDVAGLLEGALTEPQPPSPPSSPTPAPAPSPRRPPGGSSGGRLGFALGTFLGAFVISLVGGLPLIFALSVAWLVRTLAVRVRRRRSAGVLAPVAVLGLIAALALVATEVSSFGDERQAVAKLETAKAAIDEDHLVVAMKNLANASLLENESVSITVLQSCVDWALGYKDYALFEAQVALSLGYSPEEETHFRGRDCYLDVPGFRGVDFLELFSPTWLVYPMPDQGDAVGQRLLAIAENTKTRRIGDRVTAVGCLANRYDMRWLASYDFTMGLNAEYRLGAGPTPFPAIERCIRNKSMNRWYGVRTDPKDGYEQFSPIDGLERIPSPERHHPPDVCWARFPLGGPCGLDE